MDKQILKELQGVKDILARVQWRISELERRAGASTPTPSQPPKTASVINTPPSPTLQPLPPKPQRPVRPSSSETLETRIGRDWLNRIGVVSLVLGVAFFILYTFQYLGPVMKLATGFAVAGGLLGLGVWLERRAALRWYALGLIGGGWALGYFTTYAMHHIPAVRIVESAWVDLMLLMAVAAGAVSHSLKYRSETVTSLALLLGFITTAISNVTYFTFASSVLLVGALAWIVIRQRWHGLYLYGVVASYATYFFWIAPQIHLSQIVAIRVANVAQAEFWLKTSFVSLYWVAYTIVLLAFDERQLTRRNALLTATLVNALLFVQTILLGMAPLYREWRHLFLVVVGAAYVLSEPLTRRRALPTIAAAHLLVGLTFMTLAIPLKLSGRWMSFLWTLEVAAFVWLGLRYARWSYRLFAFGLAVVVFSRLLCIDLSDQTTMAIWHWSVRWRVLIECLGIGSCGLAAIWYRRFSKTAKPIESQAFHVYLAASTILAWFLLMVEINIRWLSLSWVAEAAGSVLLGFWLKDRATRLLGVIGCGVTAALVSALLILAAVGDSTRWNPWAAVGVIALLYGLGWRYRSGPQGGRFESEAFFQDGYVVVATALLTALLYQEVNRHWLSVAWSAQGLTLVAMGFLLRDRVFRVSGLVVFGLLVLKILFIDLAGTETIYRILSFIVAGVILLVASFAYARFSEKLTPPDKA